MCWSNFTSQYYYKVENNNELGMFWGPIYLVLYSTRKFQDWHYPVGDFESLTTQENKSIMR